VSLHINFGSKSSPPPSPRQPALTPRTPRHSSAKVKFSQLLSKVASKSPSHSGRIEKLVKPLAKGTGNPQQIWKLPAKISQDWGPDQSAEMTKCLAKYDSAGKENIAVSLRWLGSLTLDGKLIPRSECLIQLYIHLGDLSDPDFHLCGDWPVLDLLIHLTRPEADDNVARELSLRLDHFKADDIDTSILVFAATLTDPQKEIVAENIECMIAPDRRVLKIYTGLGYLPDPSHSKRPPLPRPADQSPQAPSATVATTATAPSPAPQVQAPAPQLPPSPPPALNFPTYQEMFGATPGYPYGPGYQPYGQGYQPYGQGYQVNYVQHGFETWQSPGGLTVVPRTVVTTVHFPEMRAGHPGDAPLPGKPQQ
jgi:hypothetical protein